MSLNDEYIPDSGNALDDDDNVINWANVVNSSMGRYGLDVIDDTNAHTGVYSAIVVLEETVMTVVGTDVTGMTSITIPAGFPPIVGNFTSITLTSGSVIAYKGA